jgi:hypothetical protein
MLQAKSEPREDTIMFISETGRNRELKIPLLEENNKMVY